MFASPRTDVYFKLLPLLFSFRFHLFQKIKDEASSNDDSDGEKGDDEDDAPSGSSKPKKVIYSSYRQC